MPNEPNKLPPVVVMAFDRPEYLRQVLLSLKNQANDILRGRKIYLFQDGAVNAYSGRRYAADSDIDACARIFSEIFPDGLVHQSSKNIGICESFDRAENHVFEVEGNEVAYFLEDDMVLSPYFISSMDRLYNEVADIDRIAYFSVHGDHRNPKEKQLQNRDKIIRLEHHWAFGLKRSHWREMRAFLQPYFRIVVGKDYRDRDEQAIRAWHSKIGYGHSATSQDGAKTLATVLLKRWRIGTYACWGRYIGELGTHFNPNNFAEFGFRPDQYVMEEPLSKLSLPSEREMLGHIEGETGQYRDIAKRFSATDIDSSIATEDDIRYAYRLFLGREPESTKVTANPGSRTIAQVRETVLLSDEFRSRQKNLITRIAETKFGRIASLLRGGDPYIGLKAERDQIQINDPLAFDDVITKWLLEIRPHMVLEIGAWEGVYTLYLAQIIKKYKLDTTIVAVDTWLSAPLNRVDVRQGQWRVGADDFAANYSTYASNILIAGHQDVVVPLPMQASDAIQLIQRYRLRNDVMFLGRDVLDSVVTYLVASFFGGSEAARVAMGDAASSDLLSRLRSSFTNDTGFNFRSDGTKWCISRK